MQKLEQRRKQKLLPKRKCNLSVNIALTGTPGTGKTSLASRFEHNSSQSMITIQKFLLEKMTEGNWLIDIDKTE